MKKGFLTKKLYHLLFGIIGLGLLTGMVLAQEKVPEKKNSHLLPLPEQANGVPSITLEAEEFKEPKVLPSSTPRLYGTVTSSNAETLQHWDNLLAILSKGHNETTVTLRYELTKEVPPGKYSLWISMRQGGEASQKITVSAGESSTDIEERASCLQLFKSWEPAAWKVLPCTFFIYPKDRYLEITLTGKATERKLLDAFLIIQGSPLSESSTKQGIKLRSEIEKHYTSDTPSQRLWILESGNEKETDTLYQLIKNDSNLSDDLSIKILCKEDAVNIRRVLELSNFPNVIQMDAHYAILNIREGIIEASEARQVLSDLKNKPKTYFKGKSPPPVPISTLKNGIPEKWLTIGVWPGLGGISQYGLNYESSIYPGNEFPMAINDYDRRQTGLWREVENSSFGEVAFEKLHINCSWSRGTAYACLYLYAPTETQVELHFAQTGFLSEVWLDEQKIPHHPDSSQNSFQLSSSDSKKPASISDLSDQGMKIDVVSQKREGPRVATLPLHSGWNRLLIKCVTQEPKDSFFSFGARLTNTQGNPLQGIRTATSHPIPSLISKQAASRIFPLVYNNAPANLPHPGEPLTVRVDMESADYLDRVLKNSKDFYDPKIYPGSEPNFRQQSLPFYAMEGQLELQLTDYDGKEILKRKANITLPGNATFDLGKAPERGYYSIHLRLFDKKGNFVTTYPPDGFSVIGGTQAQKKRLSQKKMASTYYFINTQNEIGRTFAWHKHIFEWLERMGIYRNIGSTPRRNIDLYKEASTRGIHLTADLWNITDPETLNAYVSETAPYVDSFKSYNEVDIHPQIRGTPESWLKTAKLHYETVKKYAPDKKMIGASLVVRLASDSWVKDTIDMGLYHYVNVWDTHAYPQKPPKLEGNLCNSPSEGQLAIEAICNQLEKGLKPFWIGETGAWPSHGLDGRRWQADMCAKMTACALSRKDIEMIGFLLPWGYMRERTGIWMDAGHMPAEASYYTASALIDGFDYHLLDMGSDIEAARFGPTTMLWTEGESRSITLSNYKNTPTVLVDVIGRTQNLHPKPDGSIEVSISSSPIYVLSQKDYDELTR